MSLDRRQLLAAGSLALGSWGVASARDARGRTSRLDLLLDAHADLLPERAGAGANHYPMAAEALDALGFADAIDDAWIEGASLYRGPLGRAKPIESATDLRDALGDYARFGDWLDHFRDALAHEPWGAVVGAWAPRLAPALCAAAFHGVIRSGHAARALRRRDTPARRNELAVGLAYWAARSTELPVDADAEVERTLADLEHPWIDDRADVAFDDVVARLTSRPVAPPVVLEGEAASAREELDALVGEAAAGFLEMLVAERNRIWLLHTVTGPAAVEWLLPEVDDDGARRLVAYARQAVVAMFAAYGEPFRARAHVRNALDPWPDLLQRAVDSRSVHGIKLLDALERFDRDGDPLWRSVAMQWLEWT